MSNSTSPVLSVYRDKAHRPSCKRIAGKPVETDDLANVVFDAEVTPASCCRPERMSEWKAELDGLGAGPAPTDAERAEQADATAEVEQADTTEESAEESTEAGAPKPRKAHKDTTIVDLEKHGKAWLVTVGYGGAKHFWLGLGRNALAGIAEHTEFEVAISNRTRSAVITVPKKRDAEELAEDIPALYVAAAEALVQWRAEQRVHGYQSRPLRERIDADREFLSHFVEGYVAHAYGVEFDQKRYDVQDGYHAGVTAAH